MKFVLASTSYLLEKNNNWNYLTNPKNIIFSEYGKVFSSVEKKINDRISIDLVFLADLIDISVIKNYDHELKKIKKLIKKLELKLKLNNKPIIVGVCSHLYINIIESAQNFKIEKKLKYFFLNELYKLSKKFKDLYILDIDEVFSVVGINNCFDVRNFNLSRCRISSLGIELIAKSSKKIINRIGKPSKKVLLVDCDNTLWGGVVAEQGLDKIKIGEEGEGLAYQEFQKSIKKLKNQGIIIILVSKNIKEDVLNVFKFHNGMSLKMNDVTAYKINWQDKEKNILELSKDLDLNLNSFVFWDDNPIEREKIKIKLKNVEVIEPDNDISNWAKQLLQLESFSRFYTTDTDTKRTNQYRNRQKFIENKKNYNSELEYLKSIKIKAKVYKLNKGNVDRVAQMCQRTNQFNLSTKRYNHEDLLHINKKHKCFLINIKDIYGDHGIVSFVCCKIISKKIIIIDTFLMSCRVLGRYLENWVLGEILRLAKKNKVKNIVAEFNSTKQNKVAKDFLIKNNFKKITKSSLIRKEKDLNNKIIKNKSELYICDVKNKIKFTDIYA